jgi:hypothetical protein
MDINKILTADFLDILFEGKNKAYGAYELRKTYDKRLRYGLYGMFLVVAVLSAGVILSNSISLNMVAHPAPSIRYSLLVAQNSALALSHSSIAFIS